MPFRPAALLIAAIMLRPGTPLLGAQADSTQWTLSYAGRVAGQMVRWREADGGIGLFLEYNDRGRGPRTTSRIRLDARGWPVAIETDGHDYWKNPVRIRSRVPTEDSARTFRLADLERSVSVPWLVRALRASTGGTIPVRLSDSSRANLATMREVERLQVRADNGTRQEVVLVAVRWGGRTQSRVWLDAQGDLFASIGFQSTVRKGWLASLPALIEVEEHLAGAKMAESAARILARPAEAVAVTGVSVVDVNSGSVRHGMTILSVGSSIVSVQPDGSAALPAGARQVDGTGKFAMPGLWEMHAHHGSPNDFYARNRLATGVLAARDLVGTLPSVHSIVRRREAVDAGREIGLRMVISGFIDGPAENTGPTSVLVETADSARGAIRNYKRLGYNQIKIYSSLKPSLVPSIIQEAHKLGLRVSGHIPAFMTAEQAVLAGLDEINHANFLMLNFFGDTIDSRGTDRFYVPAEQGPSIDIGSERVQRFIRLLKDRKVVVDPTLCIFKAQWTRDEGGIPVRAGYDRAHYRRGYERMEQLVVALHRAGVRLVAGTDNACSVHDELEIYASAGIPVPDLLRMATLGAAEVTGQDRRLGSITPGKLADYILLDADPVADIRNLRKLHLIVKDGIPLEPQTIAGSTDWP
jgi:imidazolonepropionase-like amidohydrolase